MTTTTTATSTRLDVRKITARIGAEITGLSPFLRMRRFGYHRPVTAGSAVGRAQNGYPAAA